MINEQFGLYMIVGALTLVPVVLYMEWRNKGARIDRYRRLGLRPVGRDEFDAWVDLGGFSILGRTGVEHRRFEYVMGEYAGHKVGLFALHIADGSNTGVHQTVTVLELDEKVPRFVLRPGWFRNRIKPKFSGMEIRFEEDTTFSRDYCVDGECEADVRGLFTHAVRRQLAAEGRLWIETGGGRLVLFRESDFLVNGTRLEGFLDRATKIKNLLEAG